MQIHSVSLNIIIRICLLEYVLAQEGIRFPRYCYLLCLPTQTKYPVQVKWCIPYYCTFILSLNSISFANIFVQYCAFIASDYKSNSLFFAKKFSKKLQYKYFFAHYIICFWSISCQTCFKNWKNFASDVNLLNKKSSSI